MRRNILHIILLLLPIAAGFSCTETPTENKGVGGNGDLGVISAEDIGVTDVVLRLPGSFLMQQMRLKRDTTTILDKIITADNSLIVDENLLPKHKYTYTLSIKTLFGYREYGTLSVTTGDTTSHNFTFLIDTLGDGSSSVLNDVAIINDTLAYCVGEIYKKDSTGNFETEPYNLALWNGLTWKLMRVPTAMYGGYMGTFPLTTVFGFSQNDIWTFSIAGSYSHWDGQCWNTEYVAERSGGGKKLWGTSSSNLYLVGTNGSISWYNGIRWVKLNSGTTLDIQDIYGGKNEKTGETEIVAMASETITSYEPKILKITGTTVAALSDYGIGYPMSGIWFVPGKRYYAVGRNIYVKRNILDRDTRWLKDAGSFTSRYYKTSVCGNGINDIVVACQRGELLHFNGYSWVNFKQTAGLDVGSFSHHAAIKGNMIVAVGNNNGYAVVAIGRRLELSKRR